MCILYLRPLDMSRNTDFRSAMDWSLQIPTLIYNWIIMYGIQSIILYIILESPITN